ncbi:TPA: hypothetical protein ACXN34_007159, partial [Burkholderia cepacia]
MRTVLAAARHGRWRGGGTARAENAHCSRSRRSMLAAAARDGTSSGTINFGNASEAWKVDELS